MKILFCSDGSVEAENAVRFAAPIAAGCQADATILGISENPDTQDALLQSLRRGQEILKQHHLNAELATKAGRPVPEIVKRTRETPCDLVVIGARRRPGHGPVLRSVKAYQIVEAVEPPVLVVVGEPRPMRRILLCTGGGPHALKAVQFTGTLARCAQAEVTLFHVLAAPPALYADLLRREEDVDRLLHSDSALGRHLRQQQEGLTQLGVPCAIRVRHGLIIPELLTELQQTRYDLVVSGSSPARERLRAYIMGNVTRQIVNHAEWPVLILRTAPAPHRWPGFVSSLFSAPHPFSRQSR
jgi:nucleotide-binding universal stress UspA family protein